MWNDVLNRMDKVLVPKISAQHWGNASEIELVSEGINLVYRFILNNQKYYLHNSCEVAIPLRAPGGGNTQQWLSAIKEKIINNDWLDQLPQEFR